ncbi:MAG: tetratricopeptide repeat protein, partial [Bryobacteraceae bacterium]
MVKSVAIALASILLSTTLVAQPQGQSEPKEISDLRKAAEQGDAQKQWDLGGRYYSGKGVAEDHSEALKWYSKAAEQGDPEKQFRVGFMYWLERNNVEAAKWYRKAAEQGVVLAQSDLGDMYRDGKGVPQNYVEAAKWYHRAAENETVEKNGLIPTQAFSQYSLGAQYESGLGVLQDYVEAAKWYRKAVESGDSMAVFSLYSLCLNGKST